MFEARNKFVPLSKKEEELVERVLSAGDRIIEHLDSLANGKPKGFWVELFDRLLELARFGPKLLSPYAPDVPKTTEKQYHRLGEGMDKFFARFNLIALTLQDDNKALELYFKDIGHDWDEDANSAALVITDLAELAHDFIHFRRGWDLLTPAVRAEVEWSLRFEYEQHWGEHLHRALLTTYQMVCWVHAE